MNPHIETLEAIRANEHACACAADVDRDERFANVAALDAAIALMRGQSWQPIETAPKEEGLKILGASNAPWTQDYYPVLVYEGQRFGANKQYFGWYAPFDHDDRAPDPTHWQPLPAPPKDSANE